MRRLVVDKIENHLIRVEDVDTMKHFHIRDKDISVKVKEGCMLIRDETYRDDPVESKRRTEIRSKFNKLKKKR